MLIDAIADNLIAVVSGGGACVLGGGSVAWFLIKNLAEKMDRVANEVASLKTDVAVLKSQLESTTNRDALHREIELAIIQRVKADALKGN